MLAPCQSPVTLPETIRVSAGGLLIESLRDPALDRIDAAAHQLAVQRRGPAQHHPDPVAGGSRRIAIERHTARFGKMPEDLHVMLRRAENVIRDSYDLGGTLVENLAAMHHRVVQTAVTVVLRDDPLLVGTGSE